MGLPGFYDEEANTVEPAAYFLNVELQNTPWSISLLAHYVAKMTTSWVGSICWLVLIPFLKLFGTSVYAIRLPKIFYGLIGLILIYYFSKKYFNTVVARVSCLCLVTLPFYVFAYRHGYLDDGLLPLFAVASFLCFYTFDKTSKTSYLLLGSFFMGVGLLTKLNFLWFMTSFLFALLVFNIKLKLTKTQIFLVILLFLVGCSPLLYFNIKYSGSSKTESFDNTLDMIKNNLVVTDFGTNNLDVAGNLKTRFGQ
ncbi:MAG: glycosyltransferase family 39 protein [bacterium]|nr:glycosyltransferase family 39 protein [bacterium]